MHRIRYIGGCLLLMLGATLVLATVTPANKNGEFLKFKLDPYEDDVTKLEFVGKERAAVACVGEHKTFLGLYVYDANGNCVAWDDLIANRGRNHPDAVAVEWYPAETGAYRVELVNFGGAQTECSFVAK